jgi:FkbM family methyltransferase
MNPLKIFQTPEYLFRPSQIVTRLKRSLFKPRGEIEPVRLPWGLAIRVRPAEVIGSIIWYYGVFDLIVTEAIARLVDPGETCLDIGANIGQMTSLMMHRTGPSGHVHAFEPHPEVFQELHDNVARWVRQPHLGQVTCHETALSDRQGEEDLVLRAEWRTNRGIGTITGQAVPSTQHAKVKVRLASLDQILDKSLPIGLCKIDVEGHEMQVLCGARQTLSQGRVRDIVFEDLDPASSSLPSLLASQGYTLFALWSRITGPVISPVTPGAHPVSVPLRDGSNFLATRAPDRAVQRFRSRGWKVLRSSPVHRAPS